MNEKLWNFKFCSVIFINSLISFSFYMITTILMVYLTGIGVNLSKAGLIVGLFSITSLFIRPFTGYITDQFNRKKLLIIGNFFVAISIMAYVITDNLMVIILFRVIHGIAFGINSTAIVAMASEYIPSKRFNEGIGYLGLGQVIASAVGPGLGVALMVQYGIKYAFYVSALFSLFTMLYLLLFHYSKMIKESKSHKILLQDIISLNVLDYAFIAGVYSFMNGGIAAFLVIYAQGKSIEDVSIYFTVSAVFLFLARPLSGKIVDKMGLKYIVYPGIIMTIISLIFLASADSLAMILVSAVIRALAQGAVQPLLQAASIKKVGIEKSGLATSTFYLGGDIGQGAGPMIGGVIAKWYGYEEVFYLCVLLMILALVVFYFSNRKEGKKQHNCLS
ncbi:MFS transporter [Clostridium sp. E02]|uniref:MFS transporter n=1 Tax=Clostridium sp. E02 TaxID=2487134 RepID=UPI000F52D5BE|nr:MFS transporter [Clostridium sp. E02]